MTQKLTKTQAKLLRQAQGSSVGTVSALVSSSSSSRRTYGWQDYRAAESLADLGLLTSRKADTYNVSGYNGNSTHCLEGVWSITDAGRNLKLEG